MTLSFFIYTTTPVVWADSSKEEEKASSKSSFSERAETGFRDPVGWHYYWRDGYLGIDSREENIKFEINGHIHVDGGSIIADDELKNAFPELDGSEILLRNLKLSVYGNFYDKIDFDIGIDFANVRDIQDVWIRYLGHPILKKFKMGHIKEPFSLEYLTSINRITFMERSLPDQAFGFGRNIGIRYDSLESDKRINWGAGAFYNTGSFSSLGDAQSRVSESNGFDLTARVFGLPVYAEKGKTLLHLGLGFNYALRDEDEDDPSQQIRARPESRLTDIRLVDTGKTAGKKRNTVNTELAMVFGPWSFQGQYYNTFIDSNAAGDPNFWGYYVFLSYFVTGERRKYNPSLGIFTGVDPQPSFHPRKGDWGAVEIAARHSYVDLNDGNVSGGQESNISTGLNWYHNRNVRLMFNYTHAYLKNRESPIVENGRTHIIQARFQFIF